MAQHSTLSVTFLGILILLLYISESECKPLQSSITSMSDKDPEGYTHYLRKALMDASHVLDNLIQKGKMRLMDLPYEGWIRF